jgi:hypothetical protein
MSRDILNGDQGFARSEQLSPAVCGALPLKWGRFQCKTLQSKPISVEAYNQDRRKAWPISTVESAANR